MISLKVIKEEKAFIFLLHSRDVVFARLRTKTRLARTTSVGVQDFLHRRGESAAIKGPCMCKLGTFSYQLRD